MCGTFETERKLNHRCFCPVFVGQVDPVQVVPDDLLDTPYVDEIKGQCTATSLIDASGAVLLAQALEFLSLSELRPGERAREQGLHEFPYMFAPAFSFADQTVGIAHGIGCEFLGIVIVVGRATTGWLPFVGFDEFATDVDAYELAVTSHPSSLPDIPGGNRIKRLAEIHMMIGMDLVLAPEGRVEALLLEG